MGTYGWVFPGVQLTHGHSLLGFPTLQPTQLPPNQGLHIAEGGPARPIGSKYTLQLTHRAPISHHNPPMGAPTRRVPYHPVEFGDGIPTPKSDLRPFLS